MTGREKAGNAARLKRIALDVDDLLAHFGTATIISYPAWRDRFRRRLVSPIDGELLREAPNEEANTRKWDRVKKDFLEAGVPLERLRVDDGTSKVGFRLTAGAYTFVEGVLD